MSETQKVIAKLQVYDPTLRCATPKYTLPSRLDVKVTKDKQADKDETRWKRQVWTRDRGRCRACQCRVVKSLERSPKRGECHHLKARREHAVRWDVRNGALLCLRCHADVERYRLLVIQVAASMFQVGEKSYINADKPIEFRRRTP